MAEMIEYHWPWSSWLYILSLPYYFRKNHIKYSIIIYYNICYERRSWPLKLLNKDDFFLHFPTLFLQLDNERTLRSYKKYRILKMCYFKEVEKSICMYIIYLILLYVCYHQTPPKPEKFGWNFVCISIGSCMVRNHNLIR